MKKKQFYEKPSMQVFELEQQPQLLEGSAVGAEHGDDYGTAIEDTWEE
jgi:hypothetical protein